MFHSTHKSPHKAFYIICLYWGYQTAGWTNQNTCTNQTIQKHKWGFSFRTLICQNEVIITFAICPLKYYFC